MTGTGKAKAWKEVTDAVNAVSVVQRTMSEVKRKWFDMKLEAKKRISTQIQKGKSTYKTHMQLYRQDIFLPISQPPLTAPSSKRVPTALLRRINASCVPPGHRATTFNNTHFASQISCTFTEWKFFRFM